MVTKAYLERESGSLDAGICRQQAQNDFQAWFSYRHGGSSEGQVRLRESTGWMGVRITASALTLWQSGGSTTLDTETIATDTGVWYEFYAKCDGANVEVWRREKGTADPMVKVLETASTTHTTGGWFTFASGAGNALDDLVFLKLDGDTLETETYAYNAANELTSQVINGTTLTYTYDQFGRMTKKTGGGKTADYYYHYGDKLTKVASNFGGEGTVTYTYGGDQKRRSRAVTGGDTTKYRYGAGWDVLNEEDGSGTLRATYVHHPGKQIGTVLATSEGTSAATGTWNYYFQDAIGSTRGLWDQDGDRIGKYEYTPFGGKYADHGEDITRKFTGHAWDSEARLYYTAYRYYSPDANRWLTRDPLGMVDGPNVYAYVVNNPVAFWDALGLYLNYIPYYGPVDELWTAIFKCAAHVSLAHYLKDVRKYGECLSGCARYGNPLLTLLCVKKCAAMNFVRHINLLISVRTCINAIVTFYNHNLNNWMDELGDIFYYGGLTFEAGLPEWMRSGGSAC